MAHGETMWLSDAGAVLETMGIDGPVLGSRQPAEQTLAEGAETIALAEGSRAQGGAQVAGTHLSSAPFR